MSEIKFEIIENFGILGTSSKGWAKELNLVSWNEREAKYDIREWAPDHSKMAKGVTFTKEEMMLLKEFLSQMNLD